MLTIKVPKYFALELQTPHNEDEYLLVKKNTWRFSLSIDMQCRDTVDC
jgi:hypothetical protein